jgi:hypothetical protein
MRWTKTALLVFGLGLVLGFVAVVGEIPQLDRVSSVTMALALAGIPLALFADGRGIVLLRWIARRFSRKPPPKPRRQPKRASAGGPKLAGTRAAPRPRSRAAPAKARRKRR